MNVVFQMLQSEKATEWERERTPSQAHQSRNDYIRYWGPLEQHHLKSQHKHLLLSSQKNHLTTYTTTLCVPF